jgi:hypothetical protein
MSATPYPLRALVGRGRWRALAALAALPLLVGACGGATSNRVGQGGAAATPAQPVLHESTDQTIGISNSSQGYTFDSAVTTLPADQEYQFRILGPDGTPQTSFLWDQTKLLHLLVIRADFTGFAHVHPTLAPNGTWTVRLPLAEPGPYQIYTDFLLKDAQGQPRHLVLRRPLTVPGPFKLSPVIPAPSMTAKGDGYDITFLKAPRAWTVMLLPARVSRDDGSPVTNLEPYLAVFAHFTAFKESDDLYGHAHPLEYAGAGREGWPQLTNIRGGPTLTFHAEFPGSGDYRAFVEFQVAGVLHTASFTLHVQ